MLSCKIKTILERQKIKHYFYHPYLFRTGGRERERRRTKNGDTKKFNRSTVFEMGFDSESETGSNCERGSENRSNAI
jgi:hypothetical protein